MTRCSPYLAALRFRQAGLGSEFYADTPDELEALWKFSGHVGIWQARHFYSRNHPGEDVCSLSPDDRQLPDLLHDVQDAVRSALPTGLSLINALGRLGKPLHFHLHDAHPLSTFSPYGVSNHLSFLLRIPIPFAYEGKSSLGLMYGPTGLFEIISESIQMLGAGRLSYTLEIHDADGRLPLRDGANLFRHWRDKTNAERMNQWLWVLLENHQLLGLAMEMSSKRSRQ
jgi:hypothetical protein